MKILQILVLIFGFIVIVNAQHDSKLQEQSEQKMILTGAIFDKNGAVILNAKIVAIQNSGTKYETNTDTEGIYRIELPLTIYNIEVSAAGFCTSKIASYRIVDSTYKKMSLDVVLEVASYPTGCKYTEIDNLKQKKNNKKSKKTKTIVLM